MGVFIKLSSPFLTITTEMQKTNQIKTKKLKIRSGFLNGVTALCSVLYWGKNNLQSSSILVIVPTEIHQADHESLPGHPATVKSIPHHPQLTALFDGVLARLQPSQKVTHQRLRFGTHILPSYDLIQPGTFFPCVV